MKKIVLIVFLFAVSYVSRGQISHYQFSQLDITSGLSHNQVNCIFKDQRGFMWFGTLSGLNCYDGYKFHVYKSDPKDTATLSDDIITKIYEGPGQKLWIQSKTNFNIYDPLTDHVSRLSNSLLRSLGLPAGSIINIKKDAEGNFWFVYNDRGIYYYNSSTKKTINFYGQQGYRRIGNNDISDVQLLGNDKIWVIHQTGKFELFDTQQQKIIYSSDAVKNDVKGIIANYHLYKDNDNDLWIYSSAKTVGIYCFNTAGKTFKHFTNTADGGVLRSDIIFSVLEDNKGTIWVATDHGGINLIDKKSLTVRYLLNREDDNKSIAQNSVITLYKDNTGIIWAGTYKKGISYYHENIIRFPLYKHHAFDEHSLSFNDINRFAEDAAGNIWIGTNGGGLIYFNIKTGTYTNYRHDEHNTNSLANDVIVSLYVDHNNKLWIGSYWGGLDSFDSTTQTFKHYKHNENDKGSLSDDRVWEIMEDTDHRLWVGTLAGGLNCFDSVTQIFKHYMPAKNNSVSCIYISALCEDSNKNIWIGGYSGIDVLSKQTGKFIHYTYNSINTNSLPNNYIYTIRQDSRKLMWIGTNQGLSVLNSSTGTFTNFKKEDGLPDNVILDAIEDDNHDMWISTPNGLCKAIINSSGKNIKLNFKNFDETDGLQGRDFNENAAYRTKSGYLLFGGANGFNMFKPSVLHFDKTKINLVFTDLQIFNKSINAGEAINSHTILQNTISETKNITLHHDENVFAIEFASLNFFNADKLSYQYMMQGFDKDWLSVSNKVRKATYTNLDPGSYVFRVRVINPEIPGRVENIALNVKILPPFWKTTFAYFLYITAFLGFLFYIRYRGIQKLKAKFKSDQERKEAQHLLELERQDAKRLHDLDLMKIKFFTNVSHEFRTPLSLIITPIDKMLENGAVPENSLQLQMIKRNARRLLNMVNQLLDFRKMESHELKLHNRRGDIIKFIKEIAGSFSDIAGNNQISFVFDSEIDHLFTSFDHDKIERILFNLLSNAFKFTQPGGHVSVLLSTPDNENEYNRLQVLEIKIIDTGIGIPQEKLEKIFERFFQNDLPGSMLNQGSGIGLSIVKEFVKMHGGEVTVESETDQGSCFIVKLPLRIEDNILPLPETGPVEVLHIDTTSNKGAKKPVVLLIEDNDDFRFYLKDNLKTYFTIIEACNGKEGWQKALALHPDLIVSDVNMPEMNGVDLCQKLKNDTRTTHIPVVLLTALSGEEQQLQGLLTGATDYMTKPFNFEILLSKLKNILAQQELMRKTFKKQVEINPSEVIVESPNEKFVQKALQVIEQNIDNSNFCVEELSSQMCMSRVTLYKRSLELTGKSPVELIRSVRLKRAMQLLEKGYLTISQVSYKVGFKNQKYFTKSFKAEFNMLPSEYILLKEEEVTKHS